MASASLGDDLDLRSVAMTLDGAEYEPEKFPGVIYRLKQPKTAILLFSSGKLVCTGGKSMTQVNESIRTVSAMIRKGGQRILATPKAQVQNIVATSDLESEINLNSIAITLGLDRVEYEPEQFPGLVCRMDKPRVVVLLFGSGKLVCTGARRPSDVTLAVEKITKELQDAGLLRRQRNRAPAGSSRVPRSLGVSVTAPRTSVSRPAVSVEASASASASQQAYHRPSHLSPRGPQAGPSSLARTVGPMARSPTPQWMRTPVWKGGFDNTLPQEPLFTSAGGGRLRPGDRSG